VAGRGGEWRCRLSGGGGHFVSQDAASEGGLFKVGAGGTHLLPRYPRQRRFSWAGLLNFSLIQSLTSFLRELSYNHLFRPDCQLSRGSVSKSFA
jgi:hypothetical protein